MQLFIDSANLDEIREAATWGILSGVTTNPSLMAKESQDPEEILKEICRLIPGPISGEVISVDAEGMVAEGRQIAKIAPNMVVKVPMGEEGVKATKRLSAEGIKTNVTLIFSANQAMLAAMAGATYVSPFIGRFDDCGEEGINLIGEIREIFDNYQFETKILTASVRHPVHVTQAAKLGSDVATCPYKVLKQMFRHPLTDKGLEGFLKDNAAREARAKEKTTARV